ncbi:hypothetical protein [Algicola sagamiensis]|uniref:hypothetical protein n=1 Tax=Algicola sagamiensis TaxID=163869 RepID=UPI0003809CD3|nr:hypothetical protein [Algicola sagamiensis]
MKFLLAQLSFGILAKNKAHSSLQCPTILQENFYHRIIGGVKSKAFGNIKTRRMSTYSSQPSLKVDAFPGDMVD